MHHPQDIRFSHSIVLLFFIFYFIYSYSFYWWPRWRYCYIIYPYIVVVVMFCHVCPFLWVQINSVYFLNSYCDNNSSFFLYHIIRWAVLYNIYGFKSITLNPNVNNAHYHLWFLIQCWKFYESQSWLETSTEFMLLL